MKPVFSALAFLAYAARLAAPQVATEAVTVSVTIPVRVPLTVAPGETFDEAAAAFCARNKISTDYAASLKEALDARWRTMQDENRAARCLQWQRQHSVVPLQTWGTLPMELRVTWLDLDCDAVVPARAPVPKVSLPVQVLDEVMMLDLYEGESSAAAVHEFCVANSVDEEANGAKLRAALDALVDPEAAAAAAAQAASQAAAARRAAEESAAKERAAASAANPPRGAFLFNVPVQIDGSARNLEVHEGDDLVPLVSAFCSKYGIDEGAYGEVLRKEVLKTLEQRRLQLIEEMEKDIAEQEKAKKERLLMFSLPVALDGGRTVNLDVYDGDLLSEAVSRFCRDNSIDEAAHGTALKRAAMDRYEATQRAQAAAAAAAEQA